LQSLPLNRLALTGLGGLRIKSFSLKLSAEVFAISCRRILAPNHNMDAFLFIMNLVVIYKCYRCQEYQNSTLKLKVPYKRQPMWKTQHDRKLGPVTPGPFAPWSESANRTLADSLPGIFVPWPIRSLAHSLPALSLHTGQFALILS